MRMLIVEDERALATLLGRQLQAAGHEVEIANDGNCGLAKLAESTFDLLLLDLNLPGCDGIEVLRAARRSGDRTVIVVVSGRASLEERLRCFELGADECVAKPFVLRELIVRVDALLRRARARPDPVLRCADLELNPGSRSVERGGKSIELSAREYALIEYLLQHKGRCVPRATLLKQVWEMSEQSSTNVVEVYVNYIRRKIDQGFDQPLIHTVRGQGYVMRDIDAAASAAAASEASALLAQPGKTSREHAYPVPASGGA